MRTMSMLFCLHGAPVAPPFGGCAFNHPVVISNLIWAVVVIVLGAVACCFLKKRLQFKKDMADADHRHEKEMKEKSFEIEERWFDKNKQAKDDELTRKIKEYNELTKITQEDELARKIREYNELTKITQEDELARKVKEYNELTIHQKIMDKVTGVDKEMKDFKEALEELKKKYEALDGEIEQIIIKKKQ